MKPIHLNSYTLSNDLRVKSIDGQAVIAIFVGNCIIIIEELNCIYSFNYSITIYCIMCIIIL
jgi:hypothetical protein